MIWIFGANVALFIAVGITVYLWWLLLENEKCSKI